MFRSRISKRLLTGAALLALVPLSLSSCGKGPQAQPEGEGSTTPTATSPASPAQTSSQSAPTPGQETPAPLAPTDQASPGLTLAPAPPPAPQPGPGAIAVDSIPAGAQPPESIHDLAGVPVAVIASPSGNICCDMFRDFELYCVVNSWTTDKPYGLDELGRPIMQVVLGEDDSLYATGRGDPPACSGLYGTQPQVLGYGQAVNYGDYVCYSAEAGMSCWDIVAKRGFTVNRDGWTEIK